MDAVEEKIKTISQQFLKAEETDYIGEAVSQTQHALQCAYFAEQAGHSEEVILASLLHDIGHYFSPIKQYKMADLGIVHHEWIGAKIAYDLHFSAKVALLIGYHVDAKRYLAAKKPLYYKRLSVASRQTLSYQGGSMNPEEMTAFEQLPYFKEILQVRVNDEKAKEINLTVPEFSCYHLKILQHMECQRKVLFHDSYPLTEYVNGEWVEQLRLYLHNQYSKGLVL